MRENDRIGGNPDDAVERGHQTRHEGYIVETTTPTRFDSQLLNTATVLRQRAASLRAQAESLTDVLAAAYRRRAAELELEAWVAEVQAGVPDHELQDAAA
jgi:hypothetical protein